MSSIKVTAGEASVASVASPATDSGSEDRDVLPLSPGPSGTPNHGHALEGKMDQLISEFMQLNATMGMVKGLESRFESTESVIQDLNVKFDSLNTKVEAISTKVELLDKRFKGLESRLEDHDRRLECLDTRVEGHDGKLDEQKHKLENQNTKLESEVRELKSQISSSVEREELMGKLVESATKEDEPSVEEAVALLPSARRLGMKSLVGKLVVSLTNALAVANCIAIFQLAFLCQLDELDKASVDTICKNFTQVSKTCTDFCNLSLEELSRFVFSDAVFATEEQVFEAIVLWIRADLSRRRSLVSELLPAVRISRCSSRFLRHTLDHFLVQDEHPFRTSVLERIQWMTSAGLGEDYFATQNVYRTDSRDVLFVMGGDKMDTVETLDPTVGSWVSHKIPDAPRGLTWIGSMGQKVLVLEWDNKRFRSLDIPTWQWTQLRYLPQQRGGYGVVASGDQVYVFGGMEPYGTRCDRYDVRSDRWGETAPLREGRGSGASVSHASKVYSSGGWSVPGSRLLSSLEVLDPLGNGKWASLPPMGVGRSEHCMTSCRRFLWAIGGYEGNLRLSDVEKYDVEGQRWSRVRPLNTPKCNLSASVIGGRVHVVGGETLGVPHVRTVEFYDEEEDHWTSAAPLHKERRCHGSCVVCSLPDADAEKLAVSIQ